MDDILNKVANSGLVTLDLEEIRPDGERVLIDIADQLIGGFLLKEKDFREFIKSSDWTVFRNNHVAITCSADAIIPTWAYMLISSAVQPYAATCVLGNLEELERVLMRSAISNLKEEIYAGKKVVIKGCGNGIPVTAYVDLMNKIRPLANSIMYGEPCSTVPLYKQKKV